MATVRELLRAHGDLPSPSASRDVEILLSYCLKKPRVWLYTWPEHEVGSSQLQCFEQLLTQRRAGMPIAYLTGERDFWSLRLRVNDATLIPRPETEALVSWALELDLPGNPAVLDLGTGSGAIALAVASERRRWRVTAVDVSAAALKVARENGVALGLGNVDFVQSDWYGALAGRRFTVLLSNPPYIDDGDPHLQRGDLRFEPRSALVAANAGLADLARLIAGATAHMEPGGWLLLEHGFAQAGAVRDLLAAAGFSTVTTRRDLAGLERITGGCWRVE